MSTKLDHILGLAILILWAAVTAYRHWDFWGVDMSALYWAGHFFALDEFDQIYVSTSDFFWKDPPGKWLELAQLYQAPKNAVAPYIYPPIVAAAVAPFTQMLSPQGFFNMFQILNAAAITWAVWASWRMWGPTRIKFTVWVLVSIVLLQLSMPATLALSLNQPKSSSARSPLRPLPPLHAITRSVQARGWHWPLRSNLALQVLRSFS